MKNQMICQQAAGDLDRDESGVCLEHDVIVTDGLRYGIYVSDENKDFRLFAYLNLTRLRRDYPVYLCRGAEDALLAMSPDWGFTVGA